MSGRRSGRGARLGMIIIFALLSALILLILIESRLSPLIVSQAESRAKLFVSESAARAVAETLGQETSAAVRVVYGSGRVSSIETDAAAVNRVRSGTVKRLCAILTDPSTCEFSVPIGNLVGSSLLSGRGFDIKVRIISVGDVSASISSRFESAGINQTVHRIYLNLSVNINILAASKLVPVRTDEDILVSETVIVGEVPSAYVTANGFSGR